MTQFCFIQRSLGILKEERKSRGKTGLSRIRVGKNRGKTRESVHIKPIQVCSLALTEVRFHPSHRGGETGTCLQVLAATNNQSFGSLVALQADTLRVLVSTWSAASIDVSVRSSLYRPRLRPR